MQYTDSNKTNFSKLVTHEHHHDREYVPGVLTRHWSMEPGNTVTYQKEVGHTLSLYLSGGTRNFRTDYKDKKGAPGKICLMPQNQDSQWIINEHVEFVHLYFGDELLKQCANEVFDLDVRFVELQDLLFSDDAKLRALFKENLLASSEAEISPLFVEQTLYELLKHLISQYNGNPARRMAVRGGLSPAHMRKSKAYIHENLDNKITLDELASVCGLSAFHYARMFKLSVGQSPGNYVTHARINRIKQLLTGNESLANISSNTGFSQQSHMTQFFKKITGVTPAVFRSQL